MTWTTAEQRTRWRRRSGSDSVVGGARRPWTSDEKRRVVAHSVPDRQLAAEIDRSITAIQMKRYRLRSGAA